MKDFIIGTSIAYLLFWIPRDVGETTLKVSQFNIVRVVSKAPEEVKDVVILVSSPSGWSQEDHKLAYEIAKKDTLVIGVDTNQYELPDCNPHSAETESNQVSKDFLSLTKYIEQTLELKKYIVPSLVISKGSMSIAIKLAEGTSEGVFKSINTIGECPTEQLLLKYTCDTKHQLQSLISAYVDERSGCPSGSPQQNLKIKLKKIADLDLSSKKLKYWPTELKSKWELHSDVKMRSLSSADQKIDLDEDFIHSMPIVELTPKQITQDRIVIIYSGDGGWADFAQDLAGEYTQRGYPVVGLSSLFYFWKKKDPSVGAQDLAKMISYYQRKFNLKNITLVGFSFGAGVLPFFLNNLDSEIKNSVKEMDLLAPGENAKFEFEFKDWLQDKDTGLPILEELKKVRSLKVKCIYAEQDRKGVCSDPSSTLKNKYYSSHKLKGGHHFNNAFDEFDHILWQ